MDERICLPPVRLTYRAGSPVTVSSPRVRGINGGCTLWMFAANGVYEMNLINGEKEFKKKSDFCNQWSAFAEGEDYVYLGGVVRMDGDGGLLKNVKIQVKN